MKNKYDAIIVGAGPAGLACASELADKGLEAVVLDEQGAPGGQIYRNINKTTPKQRSVLGADYRAGAGLVEEFQTSPAAYYPRTRVWEASSGGSVCFSQDNASGKIKADYIVICTGAMERPVPFPGWTLPGVMTCGGLSNLYKDSGLVPKEPIVLAGSGPLLWLVAEHLLTLKAPVAAICDTTPVSQMVPALRKMPPALLRLGYLLQGVKMIAHVRLAAKKAKTPIYRNVTGLRAEGDGKLQVVKAMCGGKELRFDAATLGVSEGIIPNIALMRQIGCAHVWEDTQRYWRPDVSNNGRGNLPKVLVAGDGAFVHGAKAAALKGRLSGLEIAREMLRLNKNEYAGRAAALYRQLRSELLPRPFIDALYAPRKALYSIPDDTIVCRCENVTAKRVRELVAKGLTDHNEIKSIIRCGMGPCQGRMCGPAVLELIVEGSGIAPSDARPHRLRPPIKPVSLQELANATLGGDDDES